MYYRRIIKLKPELANMLLRFLIFVFSKIIVPCIKLFHT